MIITPLAEIARQVGGQVAQDVAEVSARAVATDNRAITGGELFVAITGERVDGNAFAHQALTAGAVGVLTAAPDAATESGAPANRIVTVDDPVTAVGRLARAQLRQIRSRRELSVIGVTGSVGKTTTKDLLALLLAARGPIIAPPGSLNNELGLPLTVLRADETTATLVLEMGADHVGNLEYLTDIAPPDISVVLAVGHAHLGEFGGIEMVAKAKSELVEGTRDGGVVVLNADDERVRSMAAKAPGRVVFFSATGRSDADIYASDTVVDETGRASFTLHCALGSMPVTLGLIGRHHVNNALAASAVALELGMSLDHIAQVLESASATSPHRMDVFPARGATIIDDSYNANPESMRAGLTALQQIGSGSRTIAVLGQMLELGADSFEEHTGVGQWVAECGVDVLVAVDAEPLGDAAAHAGVQVYSVADLKAATELLDTLIVPGDVVLLKGSNGSGIWHIADQLKGGDSC